MATLKVAHTALSVLYEARGQVLPVNVQDLHRLLAATVKRRTTDALERCNVLPVEPFRQLFISWGINCQLSIMQLSYFTSSNRYVPSL